MKVSDAFPSNYLKADDLGGRDVTVTIAGVEMQDIGQGAKKESKLVIAFRGKDKMMVCNKTNANTIAKLHGDDTDQWVGKLITLCPREVEFQGEMVLAIRVSLKPVAAPKPQTKPQPEMVEPEPNEDVPF